MFAHYMANKRLDFMESSMMRKVGESTHTHTHSHTRTHSHTHTHTHSHTHTHTHTHTHISHFLSLLIALVKKLISEIDEDLFQFFEASECHDYLFCHRWLLLDFKREFVFQDSLRIFEVGKDSGIAVPVYVLNHSLLPLPPSPPLLSLPLSPPLRYWAPTIWSCILTRHRWRQTRP